MSGTSPRRRRGGSIRGEASSEPLGLDPAADQAATDAAGAAGAAGAAEVPAAAAADAVVAGEPFDETAPIGASGKALVPMVDPHGEPTDVIRDVPEMSVEDVERRIGARTRERRRRVAMATPATTRVAANRRVILWRDSATILIFVVVALLAARFLLPSDNSSATATASPTESEVAIGSIPGQTELVFSAPPTIGQVVNPSLNLNATPTPPPLITLPPPTPTPIPSPSVSPKPSVKPTPKPTAKPTAPPTAPHAVLATPTCDTTGGYSMTFDASGSTAGSAGGPLVFQWNFDEGVGYVPGSAMEDHSFADGVAFTYNVVVKVTDASGQSTTASASATVPC